MKLSIVIVNYNVRHFLEQCLHSVARAIEGIEAEVWVVDNASSDDSMSMVRERFPQVKCIDNEKNLGFSKANNMAVARSDSAYILLLNPDTIAPEDNFRKALQYMDQHADCGALGVKMIDGKGRFLPESKRGLPTPWVAFYKISGLSNLFPKSKKFARYHLGHLDPNQNNEIEILAGAYMLIRRKAWEDAGGLDERYFMYGEDIDLSYSIKRAGWSVHYLADTPIVHYKGESTRKGSLNYVFLFYQAMLIFAGKYFSKSYARLFGSLIRVAIYLRAAMSIVRRIYDRLALPLLDIVLFIAGMQLIIQYWELNHRFIQGGSYPDYYKWVIVPLYGLTWILSMAALGAYNRPVRINRLISGLVLGTGIIFSAYALSPEFLRFSRALIVLGSIWMAFAAVGGRLALSLFRAGRLGLWRNEQRRVAWFGQKSDQNKVRELLALEGDPVVHIERVDISDVYEKWQALDLNEMVFDPGSISYKEMVDIMEKNAASGYRYKVAYLEAGWLIGSDSIHERGSTFSRADFALSKSDARRSKRQFDVLLVLFLWTLTPIAIWMPRSRRLWINTVKVLFGKISWVGYASNGENLPGLKPGVIRIKKIKDRETAQTADEIYAAHYTINLDARILMRYLRKGE